MEELEVSNIEFKISRGFSPAGKRYDYNTLIIFHTDIQKIETGVEPSTYIQLKKMLGLKLTSLETVMEHSIIKSTKNNIFSFLIDGFIRPKLEIIFSEIDKVIIDTLNARFPAILGYDLLASIYLINNKKIESFNASEAAVMAKIANKKIYILQNIFEEKENFEKEKEEYQKKIILEKEKRDEFLRRTYGYI